MGILNKIDFNQPGIQQIEDETTKKYGVKLYLKRDDLLHPIISGNKWYKLKYNLVEADKKNYTTILTFGGAYSNHIHATAAAGKIFDFKTIGIIRGEEHLPLNPTLFDAKNWGMKLHYLDRKTYRKKNQSNFIKQLHNRFGNFYLIPEGGANVLAVKGAEEIINDVKINFDTICIACGTGTTFSGIITGLNGKKKALGFSALKGGKFLKNDVSKLIKNYNGNKYSNWNVILDYHFGGFAKIDKQLISFIDYFKKVHEIILDPIYNGKMLFGIYDLIKKEYFMRGEKILAINSGGLQGLRGMNEKILRIRKKSF